MSDDPAEKIDLVRLFASPAKRDVAKAKRICEGCAVRLECLEFSLLTWEPFGTWGGVSERERQRFFREVRLQRRHKRVVCDVA